MPSTPEGHSRKRILFAIDSDGTLPLTQHVGAVAAVHHVVELAVDQFATAPERLSAFDLLIIAVEHRSSLDAIRAFRDSTDGVGAVIAVSGSLRRNHVEAMLQANGVGWWLDESVSSDTLLFWINHALFSSQHRSRRFPRIPAPRQLSVRGPGFEMLGVAANLSGGGMMIEAERAATPGDVIDVRFVVPRHEDVEPRSDREQSVGSVADVGSSLPRRRRRGSIRARCEVVWVDRLTSERDLFGLGVRFLEIDARSRALISSYVLNGLLASTV